jgi:uncharacterized protein
MNTQSYASATASLSSSPDIIPREKLDFGLDGDIAKYWFDGHPFKTRMFDALSTIFPEGERYFIACVRDYRDQVSDPKLLADIRDFIRQEAQHTLVHLSYNKRLTEQGIDVAGIEEFTHNVLFDVFRKRLPALTTLSHTAALEHLTASLADLLIGNEQVAKEMDPRMHALYVWHGMEEVEHKAVAFDVMQKVGKAGYFRRVLPFLFASVAFPFNTYLITMRMLRADGFTFWQRMKLMASGLVWLYRPGGLLWRFWGPYFAYFKPGFHPWQKPQDAAYHVWAKEMATTGDPLAANKAWQA